MENKKTKKIILLVVFIVVFCLSIVGVIVGKNIVMLKQNINLDQLNQSKINPNLNNKDNRYIIIVGASQVTRMQKWYKETADGKFKKNVNLFFINQSGSGMSHQIGEYEGKLGEDNVYKKSNPEDWKLKDKLIKQVEKIYIQNRNAEIHIFFPLSGNTIKNYTCDGSKDKKFIISKDNSNMISFVKGYYDIIISLRNNYSKNKKIYGYVTAMHPDVPKQSDSKYVVNNNNSNACAKGYRSNEKYYKFNISTKIIVEKIDKNKDVLTYEPLFVQVMKIDDKNSNYSYKETYNTTDGVHWDESTTIKWVDRMINYSGRLN